MNTGKSNRLLQGLLIISLAVHLILFFKISGLYTHKTQSFIELDLKDLSNPWAREIPRPRFREKDPLKPKNSKLLKLSKIRPPRPLPQKIQPVDKTDSPVGEDIPMPELDASSGFDPGRWEPDMTMGAEIYTSAKGYLDMVELRINQHKKYPKQAQDRQIQGRVPVSFVITPDGGIRNVKLIEPKNPLLDEAAIQAIKDSAPFPRLPLNIFKGEIIVRVTLTFELT